MSFGRHNWLQFLRSASKTHFRKNGRRFRDFVVRTSAIEVLEDRTLLSNIIINDVTDVETSSGNTNFIFTVTRDNNSNLETVDFATADGTATTADGDYVTKSGTLSFVAGGALSISVAVVVTGDLKLEVNQTFVVDLTNPTGGAVITDNQGVGTITNDDTASLSISDVSINETNVGAGFLVFEVTLDNPTSAAFTVDFATGDGVATLADNDFQAASGTLNFAGTAGEMQSIVVQTVGDTFLEADEVMHVNLSNATGGVTIADSQGNGTILNDDHPVPSAPTITGPTSPTTDTTPDITWNAVARAVTYEVLIYDVDTGQEVVNQTGIATTIFTPPTLAADEHQVFVRAVNAGGNSSYSAPLLFDVVFGVPVITSPGANVDDVTPMFEWNSVDGAATYEILVYDIALGKEVINEIGLTMPEFTPTTNLDTTTFQAFVRAIDTFGVEGEYSTAAVFDVMLGVPLIADPSVTTNDTTPMISWSSVDGATSYDLLVYNILRGQAVVSQTGLTTTDFTTRNLEQGTHQAFVRAATSTSTGNFSPVYFFNVVLGAPTLTSPTAVSNDRTPTFVWTEVNGAATYELIVYNVITGQEVGRIQGLTGTQFTVQSPVDITSYQAFIRAFDAFGVAGAYGSGLNFQVIAAIDSMDNVLENFNPDWGNTNEALRIESISLKENEVVAKQSENHLTNTAELSVSMLEDLDRILSNWPQENLWENIDSSFTEIDQSSQTDAETDSASRHSVKLAAMGTLLALSTRNLFVRGSDRRRTKKHSR